MINYIVKNQNVISILLYWLKVNLLILCLMILINIISLLLVDIFTFTSLTSSMYVASLQVLTLFFIYIITKKKINKSIFDSFTITLLITCKLLLYPIITQPKLCNGNVFFISNRYVIILFLLSIYISSIYFLYKKYQISFSFLLSLTFSFIHFTCIEFSINFNYLGYVNELVWKVFN